VKRYRRKYTCLQSKVKNNISKIFQKYLFEKLKINYKNKYLNHNLNIDLFTLTKTLRKLHSSNRFELSDQKHMLENLINSLADGTLPLDSINFSKICTQIRLLLPKEKIKYINKKGSQITIQFPEREVKITKKEYEAYHDFINNNNVLRKIFGFNQETSSVPQLTSANPTSNFNFNNNNNHVQLLPILSIPEMNFSKGVPQGYLLAINNSNYFSGNEQQQGGNTNNFGYVLLVPQQIVEHPQNGPQQSHISFVGDHDERC